MHWNMILSEEQCNFLKVILEVLEIKIRGKIFILPQLYLYGENEDQGLSLLLLRDSHK